MAKSDQFIEGRIRWKASKYKIPSPRTSFFFEELSETKQIEAENETKNLKLGSLVLYFKTTEENWVLLGTRGLVWNFNNSRNHLLYQDVEKIMSYEMSEGQRLIKEDRHSLKKSNWSRLKIVCSSEETYTVQTTNGNDFFAFWNILLLLVRLNRKRAITQ